jgi:hypothetical protein
MTCMGHYDMKLPTYNKFIERTKCIRTNGMLENRLMNLYKALQINVINAFPTYKKQHS